MKKEASLPPNDDSKSFYDIPAVQAMIRFHHNKLQQYIFRPFIFGIMLLDLF